MASGCTDPVVSPPVEDLIDRARQETSSPDLLYVAALGAPTNITSALLASPDIADSIVTTAPDGQKSFGTPARSPGSFSPTGAPPP
jgi:hypothetical protein